MEKGLISRCQQLAAVRRCLSLSDAVMPAGGERSGVFHNALNMSTLCSDDTAPSRILKLKKPFLKSKSMTFSLDRKSSYIRKPSPLTGEEGNLPVMEKWQLGHLRGHFN